MAFSAPIVAIDGEVVPGALLPVVPAPPMLGLVLGLSLGDPVVCASTRGAATKTTARANMMVLLSLFNICVSPLLTQVTSYLLASTPRLHCLTPCQRYASCLSGDPAVERAILMP